MRQAKTDRDLAIVGRALGNETRLAMLRILGEKERICGDIVDLFHLSQSTVSHHLKQLREAGLVDVEERGTSTCYRINRVKIIEAIELLDRLVQPDRST